MLVYLKQTTFLLLKSWDILKSFHWNIIKHESFINWSKEMLSKQCLPVVQNVIFKNRINHSYWSLMNQYMYLNYWSSMVHPYIFQSHFLTLNYIICSNTVYPGVFLSGTKMGKMCNVFICSSLFLWYIKIFFLKANNTEHNFCVLNIVQ